MSFLSVINMNKQCHFYLKWKKFLKLKQKWKFWRVQKIWWFLTFFIPLWRILVDFCFAFLQEDHKVGQCNVEVVKTILHSNSMFYIGLVLYIWEHFVKLNYFLTILIWMDIFFPNSWFPNIESWHEILKYMFSRVRCDFSKSQLLYMTDSGQLINLSVLKILLSAP